MSDKALSAKELTRPLYDFVRSQVLPVSKRSELEMAIATIEAALTKASEVEVAFEKALFQLYSSCGVISCFHPLYQEQVFKELEKPLNEKLSGANKHCEKQKNCRDCWRTYLLQGEADGN